MPYAIETEGLSRRYGEVRAVEDLSLRVEEGGIYSFLGLNGAGKTTTIRMLLGMIHPDAGSARLLGVRVRVGATQPWASVGYLVEIPHAYPELSVMENLEAARRLHPGTPRAAVGQVMERLSLSAYAKRRAGTLSQGNAQRLGLAKALLHSPRLLVLDEPTLGLDPAGIVEIRELLLELTRQGVTVFMSSHLLAEVARLGGRIGIIHQGRLVREADPAQLEQDRRRRLIVHPPDAEAARQRLAEAGMQAESLPDGSLQLTGAEAVAHPEEVNRLLVLAGLPPRRLLVEEEDLEQYFLRMVGMEEAGGA